MQETTRLLTEIEPETKKGESLYFELCKGGYFSDTEEYGLKVTGKTVQNGTPTPENPVPIQCVKQGTRILCGNEITVPCDLYEGDIWYPISGKVKKITKILALENFWFQDYVYQGLSGVYTSGGLDNKYLRIEGYCTHEKSVGEYYNNFGTYMWLGVNNDTICWIGILDELNLSTANEFMKWVKSNHVTVVYKSRKTVIEQYEPQPIFAPKGTVNVNQQVIEQAAELSATMLVKR